MGKRSIILLSIGITSFLLVTALGILYVTRSNQTLTAEEALARSPELQTLIASRDAEYQQLIAQANEQILLANKERLVLSSSGAQAVDTPLADQNISVEHAQEVALNAAEKGAKLLKQPELVSFEGIPAYEVTFDMGIIYVDAGGSGVLFNSTIPTPAREIDQMQAIQLAIQYVGYGSVIQADQVSMSGQVLYRVIFNTGHMVYIDRGGQIVYVQIIKNNGNTSITNQTKTSESSLGSNGSSNGDDDDSHPEEEDDDD